MPLQTCAREHIQFTHVVQSTNGVLYTNSLSHRDARRGERLTQSPLHRAVNEHLGYSFLCASGRNSSRATLPSLTL